MQKLIGMQYKKIKRIFDLILAIIFSLFFFVPFCIIAVAVKFSSVGPVIFWSDRVGCNNSIFKMPKFRTMLISTPVVATHVISQPEKYLTPIGSFLRKSSLDEIPQLWNILKGEMSFVGPRPALYNQYDLISKRAKININQLLPGITGWAQINGRDELSINKKIKLDYFYLKHQSFWFDCKILFLTCLRILSRHGISH